ncbi:MAG: diacylglycerol kinase [Bdellovibrionaceae bacterium]|nr:diacylglycerol kinase [Pseudobdellovibrionaceae bacterium]
MSSAKGQNFGRRLGFAGRGVLAAFRREASLKVHAAAVVFLIVFCVWDQTPAPWIAVFTLAAALVISLELLNSAVEAMIDRLHPEHHPEIGFAKDALAGAVLIASLASLIVFAAYSWIRFAGPI